MDDVLPIIPENQIVPVIGSGRYLLSCLPLTFPWHSLHFFAEIRTWLYIQQGYILRQLSYNLMSVLYLYNKNSSGVPSECKFMIRILLVPICLRQFWMYVSWALQASHNPSICFLPFMFCPSFIILLYTQRIAYRKGIRPRLFTLSAGNTISRKSPTSKKFHLRFSSSLILHHIPYQAEDILLVLEFHSTSKSARKAVSQALLLLRDLLNGGEERGFAVIALVRRSTHVCQFHSSPDYSDLIQELERPRIQSNRQIRSTH